MSTPKPHAPRKQTSTKPSTFECFAIVAPGLETIARDEAASLGLPAEVDPDGGGVRWSGDVRSLLLANLGLRVASRIVVRMAAFEARSFAELERHARQLPWSRFVRPGIDVRFRVTCKKSRLYHSDAVAQRLADALLRAVPGARAEAASVSDDETTPNESTPDESTQLFVVRLFRDRCMVSADSSGELLHRRGYRLETARAPLRETVAAALILASGWDRKSPLVDPLCGSGTIPIEAALLARHVAPGKGRRFALERWPGFSPALGTLVRGEVSEAEQEASPTLLGSDRDAGAIDAARSNAHRAGIEQSIEFAVHALSAVQFPAGATGWVVTNPPYGVRVGDVDRVRDLWARLGQLLRERASGWHVALLSPDPALERQLKIPVRVVAQTTNGGIPVRLVVGDVA